MAEPHSMHPLDWLSCFFVVAKMRIACRRRAQRHDVQRKMEDHFSSQDDPIKTSNLLIG